MESFHSTRRAKVRNRTKFIVTIMALMVLALIVYIPNPQSLHATASSSSTAAKTLVGGASPGATQFFVQHNLLSDGAIPADRTDPNLVNAWGLVAGPTTPWWISDNGTGKSTLFNVGTN